MTIAEFWNTGKYIDYTGADEADWELLKLDKDISYTELAQNYPDLLATLYKHYGEYSGLRPYNVEITEAYRKTVLVWAKNSGDAMDCVGSLCDSGEIDIERNCYYGRTFDATRLSSVEAADLDVFHQYYDEEE